MSEGPLPSVRELSPAPSDSTVGRTIAGKFVIERKLGAGAMGVVYLARQLALDKTVAIKVMRRDLAMDETFVERFRREAKAASRLDHPNSIRVFDFGEEPDGLLYLAMEYVQGRDLCSLLSERGPLPAASIVDLLSQVLSALAVAHDLGILHRDLKPENIMVVRGTGEDGEPVDVVKVCDFGIAKIVQPSAQPSEQAPGRTTARGVLVGTPAYMSPEQARGVALDGRSDLYSVGVILYELLTGRVPFEGASALDLVLKHIGEEPTLPSSSVPAVDPRLERICMKALQKDPSDRFQTAREMRHALRSALGGSPESTPPPLLVHALPSPELHDERGPTPETHRPSRPAARRTRRWLVLALAVPAAGAVLLGSLRIGHRPREPRHRPYVPVASQARAVPSSRGDSDSDAEAVEVRPDESPARVAPAAPSLAAPAPQSPGLVESKAHRPRPGMPAPSPPETMLDLPAQAVAPVAEPPAPPAPTLLPSTAAVSAPPPPPPPPPPSPAVPPYDLASARVDIGPAASAVGATSSSVTRAVAEASAPLTSCYREALPRLTGPLEGRGVLHVETDEEGIITDARLASPLGAVVARCAASSVQGRRVANVDTGRASADIPLTFRAR